jgi:uncharacterized membrane protein
MQVINITVINPLFMVVLLGCAILSLVLAYTALRYGLTERSMTLVIGSAFYIVGSMAVTMVANVPLNNALARLDPLNSGSVSIWAGYLQNWTFWNHLRAVASLAACVAFVRAISIG